MVMPKLVKGSRTDDFGIVNYDKIAGRHFDGEQVAVLL